MPNMMDESGFQHVHLIVGFPDFPSAARGLDRIFEEPDLTVNLLGARMVSGHPRFGMEVFGVSSKVDELVYGLLPEATLHYLEPAGEEPSQEAGLEPDLAAAATA